jgi:hypothetical protein
MTTQPLPQALDAARAALAPHADPAAPDEGVTALLHGALTLIEAAQRSLEEQADVTAGTLDLAALIPAQATPGARTARTRARVA